MRLSVLYFRCTGAIELRGHWRHFAFGWPMSIEIALDMDLGTCPWTLCSPDSSMADKTAGPSVSSTGVEVVARRLVTCL